MFKVRLKLKHFNHYFELAFWSKFGVRYLEIIVNIVLNKQTNGLYHQAKAIYLYQQNIRGSSDVVG